MNENLSIAHVSSDKQIQSLQEHATGVAELCRQFVQDIDTRLAPLGDLLGWGHDAGKVQPAFQHYIRSVALEDKDAPKAPHSSAGALLCYTRLWEQAPRVARLLAYCIDGHHRGLRDYLNLVEVLESKDTRLRMEDTTDHAGGIVHQIDQSIRAYALPVERTLKKIEAEDRQLCVRSIFSSLVDADFLDTEAFMNQAQGQMRAQANEQYASLEELRRRLKAHTDAFVCDSTINERRRSFLETCRRHGEACDKGFYSLFLPTGGGKTLSSMAWALETAIRHKASRIIYAIPYTSIITQTAQIFRDVFGAENVLEHHSDIDIESENPREQERLDRAKLLSENWDAPIIVTTNIQFFESLFAHKPSKCRKVHNIANAVLVFDEVQMFPNHLLNPMLRTLESLHFCLGTQTLFCSATLPSFDKVIENAYAPDINFYALRCNIEPVVPYHSEDFAPFSRVTYQATPTCYDTEALARELSGLTSALCIVNSRADAARLYRAIAELRGSTNGLIHLSRMMCSAHIQELIAEVKSRLKRGEPMLIISTQIIEAGVDIDLPVVYRAFAGLDSLIQAGGRCNREGKLTEGGRVISFELKDGSKATGNISIAQQAFRQLLCQSSKQIDLNAPETIEQYYDIYYNTDGQFDKYNIEDMLWHEKDMEGWLFRFEEASNSFVMIDEQNKIDIFVQYKESRPIIDQIRTHKYAIDRKLIRKLQRYKVSITRNHLEELHKMGCIERLNLGAHTQQSIFLLATDAYDEALGVTMTNPFLDKDLMA
ncbi:MAG: CRISPR-associated helicase Cas3' [Porphyromonadaceae bacterium]|nr:CRISPR-associated helicase Cas3' [Porphyromonadaceae bacterium]